MVYWDHMEVTRARYNINQQHKRGGGKKKLIIAFLLCLLVLSGGGYTAAAFSKPLSPLEIGPLALATVESEAVVLPWPVQGQAAIGSLDEGVLAKSSETEQAKPIASITKIITALAVLQKAPLDEDEQGQVYTITAEDAALYSAYLAKNGTVLSVRVGQTISQHHALQALLLVSANNVADLLVQRHFGSMEAYVAYANEMVQGFGLTNTIIDDASGFSAQTISTPSDLVIIGQKALSNPVLAAIVAQREAFIPGVGLLTNTNRLLTSEDVIGLKTGTTDEAGYCLLFAAKHTTDDGHQTVVIGTVMGAANAAALFRDARALLDASYPNFGQITIVPAGTVVGTVSSAWGYQAQLVSSVDLLTYGWKGKDRKAETSLQSISTMLAKGESVGVVRIVGSEETADVVTDSDINEPSNLWRLRNF